MAADAARRRADADADPAQAGTSCADERPGSSDATLGRVDRRVSRRRSTRERISGLSTEDMLYEDGLATPLRESATRIPASCATFLSAEERARIKRAIAGVDLYQHVLGPAQLELLCAHICTLSYAVGETVFSEGEEATLFYIVRSGSFEGCAVPNAEDLSHLTPAAQGLYSDNEPLVTPVTYGVDDAFGRAALLGGCRRTRTARCTAAGTLWALDQLPFRRVLAGHHLLGRTPPHCS